jgi:hypothetical protein
MVLVGLIFVIGAQANPSLAAWAGGGWAAVHGCALVLTLFCRKAKICWYSAAGMTIAVLVGIVGSMGYIIWKIDKVYGVSLKDVFFQLWENQDVRIVLYIVFSLAVLYLVMILLFIIFRKYHLNGRVLLDEINKRAVDYLEKQDIEIVSKLYRCNSRKICWGIICMLLSIGACVVCCEYNTACIEVLLIFAFLGFVVTLLGVLFNVCRGIFIRRKLACPVPVFHIHNRNRCRTYSHRCCQRDLLRLCICSYNCHRKSRCRLCSHFLCRWEQL